LTAGIAPSEQESFLEAGFRVRTLIQKAGSVSRLDFNWDFREKSKPPINLALKHHPLGQRAKKLVFTKSGLRRKILELSLQFTIDGPVSAEKGIGF